MIERVAARYVKHAEDNQLFATRQSAYHRCHSTETAVTVVHNDLVLAADAGRVTALVLLDLSSDFDKVAIIRCCSLHFSQSLESTD